MKFRFRDQALLCLSAIVVASAYSADESRPVAVPMVPEHVTELRFDMPGMQVASLVDPTYSTGATVFFFPHEGRASFDSRGGSVASVETTLLEEGSYSNEIDAIVFAGGSTMGLAAADGVREKIFQNNIHRATQFDFVPSVPAAVVYDYGGRNSLHGNPFVYPDNAFGKELMKHLGSTFPMGRTGAGVSTTVNKVGYPFWGGQGAAYAQLPWGKVFCAVVLNACGDVQKDGVSLGRPLVEDRVRGARAKPVPGHNTTLSLCVTDVPLDRNQLKRLSVMVHTSMGKMIDPFHTYTDGDINFAVSVPRPEPLHEDDLEISELAVQSTASRLMRQAIESAVRAANRGPLPVPAAAAPKKSDG